MLNSFSGKTIFREDLKFMRRPGTAKALKALRHHPELNRQHSYFRIFFRILFILIVAQPNKYHIFAHCTIKADI
jgi:hypothetical protein